MNIRELKLLIADLPDDARILEGPALSKDSTKPDPFALVEVSLTIERDDEDEAFLWVEPLV